MLVIPHDAGPLVEIFTFVYEWNWLTNHSLRRKGLIWDECDLLAIQNHKNHKNMKIKPFKFKTKAPSNLELKYLSNQAYIWSIKSCRNSICANCCLLITCYYPHLNIPSIHELKLFVERNKSILRNQKLKKLLWIKKFYIEKLLLIITIYDVVNCVSSLSVADSESIFSFIR